jgi:hypothetical protein
MTMNERFSGGGESSCIRFDEDEVGDDDFEP